MLKSHWEFIKSYPYWKKFKEDAWFYFHPIHNFKRTWQFTKDGDTKKLDNYYENYKKEKAND